MKFKNLSCFIFTVISIFCMNYAYADNLNKDIVISDAWVQAMPPSQTTSAAYMTVTNNSQKEVVIAAVSSDASAAAEIHHMSEMNGMMNMALVSNLSIPAQGRLTLQPGGFHIMLVNLKKPVNKGDAVAITLHLQDGSIASGSAQVKDQQTDDSSSMAGMKM